MPLHANALDGFESSQAGALPSEIRPRGNAKYEMLIVGGLHALTQYRI